MNKKWHLHLEWNINKKELIRWTKIHYQAAIKKRIARVDPKQNWKPTFWQQLLYTRAKLETIYNNKKTIQ